MSFAVWLTGLPASGKSAAAGALLRELRTRGIFAARLESDVMRTQLTPFPRYDEPERNFFYRALADFAACLVKDLPVIIDATAHRRAFRERARDHIARFAEVYVSTPAEVCAARDPKGLYQGTDARQLPGAGVGYETPLAPDLVISGHRQTPAEGAGEIIALLERRGWLLRAGPPTAA